MYYYYFEGIYNGAGCVGLLFLFFSAKLFSLLFILFQLLQRILFYILVEKKHETCLVNRLQNYSTSPV